MGAMQNAFTAVACILLLALTGAAIYLAGWLRDDHLPLLSTLVIKVALPCMIFNNILGQYTPESLAENAPALLAAFVSVILTLVIALPLGKLLKLPGERLGPFVVMFAFSNSVFIGVPVSRALFGEEATPYTLLYYIANTSLFWGVGFPLMRKWGGATPSGKRRLPPAPLIVFLACVALVFLRFSPPQFLMDTCGYLGNLVTPLSLLFIGAVMARMVRARTFRWEKGYLAATLGRFAMDVCLYMSQNFGFVSFPDELTTGSSIMPHKKNPDVWELIRGKCNLIQGLPNQIAMMTTNLPLGYNRDLQLLKEVLFPAIADLRSCLSMAAFMLGNIRVKEHILDDPKYDYLFSVEVVNDLVLHGTPFREAYKKVGLDIENGTFKAPHTVHHTHEGSIGNLCTQQIAALMDAQLARFHFERVEAAEAALVQP